MKWPGRFEWKILGAMLAVATLAVALSAYALNFMVRRFADFSLEHDAQMAGSSARAAEVFRSYFADRKDEFRRRAEAIVADPPARMADLAAYEGLLRAQLLVGTEVVDTWEAPAETLGRSREAPPILVALPAVQGEPSRALELVFGIPAQMYQDFLALRAAIEQEQQIDRVYGLLLPRFLRQYLILVLAILAVAPIVGWLVARRVTKRVARLHAAARAVGDGNLSVRVAPKGKDELDELGRAFDRMVAELAQAHSRVEYLQKVSAWQEVARRLAHEIKNPLMPIQLAVQEIASKYPGDDPAYRRLLDTATEILREEITGLRRLVEDFSAFAKLPKVEPTPLDLVPLVEEIVRLQPEWQSFVTVETSGPVSAPCDKLLFRRVIANLVENALQASSGAGREPQVVIRVEQRPDRKRVAILVDDNGPGVPEAERQRVFDPYVTFRPGGTGLGLAIVRKIVIDHGGDVSADAAPAPLGGARFVVELPC
jgi:two-component system, NtrC family, nitrogen regulation sensor histidine kinase NtrY